MHTLQGPAVLWVASFMTFGATPNIVAQTAFPSAVRDSIIRVVERERIARRIPGLTLGIALGDTRWSHGFGLADLENGTPATPESSYRLASITKPMTATAIMQLVDQGKIDLDAEIQRYVPYFPKKQWPITVRDVLGHLAGITDYQGAAEERLTDHKTTRESIAIFENRPLAIEPRTDFFYTSYGYNLLGAAIEEVTGRSYADYMRDAVWGPAGMRATRMEDPHAIVPHRVRGYALERGQVRNSDFVNISSRGPAGGTRGTVDDLLRFGQATYLAGLVSPSARAAMWTPGTTRNGSRTSYGLGWDLSPVDGAYVVGHTGAQQETATALFIYPTRRMVIAIAANLEGADVSAIARGVFRILSGTVPAQRIYVRSRGDRDPTILAMEETRARGLARFERDGRIAPDTNATLRYAFDQWRKGRPDSAEVVGAFMASRLGETPVPDAIMFFAAFSRLDHVTTRIPAWAKLSDDLARDLLLWHGDWLASTGPAPSLSGLDEKSARAVISDLRRRVAGRAVYPDYSRDLIASMVQHSRERRHDVALLIGAAVTEFYPELSNPSDYHGAYGLALIAAGREAEGREYLRRAHARNAAGQTSVRRLVAAAQDFEARGQEKAALAILESGTILHASATLHFELGEIHARAGNVARARNAYSEALRLSTTFPAAERAREMLRKLSPP